MMVQNSESRSGFRLKQQLHTGKMDKFHYFVKKRDNMSHPGEFLITGDLRMADIIHINQRLLLVIERFGISLGFGDKSIAEVLKALMAYWLYAVVKMIEKFTSCSSKKFKISKPLYFGISTSKKTKSGLNFLIAITPEGKSSQTAQISISGICSSINPFR